MNDPDPGHVTRFIDSSSWIRHPEASFSGPKVNYCDELFDPPAPFVAVPCYSAAAIYRASVFIQLQHVISSLFVPRDASAYDPRSPRSQEPPLHWSSLPGRRPF